MKTPGHISNPVLLIFLCVGVGLMRFNTLSEFNTCLLIVLLFTAVSAHCAEWMCGRRQVGFGLCLLRLPVLIVTMVSDIRVNILLYCISVSYSFSSLNLT